MNTQYNSLFITALLALLVGCSTSESVDTATPDGSATSSPRTSGPQIEISSFVVSAGQYDRKERLADVSANVIEERFMGIDWEHPDKRPIMAISREIDGKLELLQVRRNQSEEGKLHVAWMATVDGQRYQAESTKIDNKDLLLSLMLSFLENKNLSETIEWDFLDAKPT